MNGVLTPLVAAALLAGCAYVPAGPSVMVLPGDRSTFEQFTVDDATCRRWAERQTGVSPHQAGTTTAVSGAAIGTAIGAAAGAAIGAAAGSPGTGAAVGAGVGLLGGSAVGADYAYAASGSLQRRYDAAYMQCMYSMGHQIPVARGSVGRRPPAAAVTTSPPPPPGVPAPPAGTAPAPPATGPTPARIPSPPPGPPPDPPPAAR